MSEDTEIFFPDTLPFPFSVRALLIRPGEHVESGQKVLKYSFVYQPAEPQSKPETRFGSWDSTFSGELSGWSVKVGDTITRERAKRRAALHLLEPCKHGMQFNGLCALCGIDMDTVDFTSRGESSRATIQMTHSASGPTVTLEEAQRLERETAERLLKARKLSLIVDLDQTIVHATVDPTVGDWIAEGEAWEERNARRIAKKETAATGEKTSNGEDSSSESGDEDDDEVNPNWDALKDVKKFRLPPDNFGAPREHWKNNKGIQNEGCLYYVKPRPGWREFLSSVATKYEMHVYTMGTRAYAEEVCAAIDPDGSLFGGRILSRDESGSLTQKSLRRLFPCDNSMVVIIDDRADVWEWSPNLIKVVPYDFFVGIGDINSAFLPKVDPSTASLGVPTTVESNAPPSDEVPSERAALPSPDASPTSTLSPLSDISDETAVDSPDEGQSVKTEMISQNALALEAQVEERPLAKKQEQLESDDDASEDATAALDKTSADPTHSDTPSDDHAKPKHHKRALLKNDDEELTRLGQLLNEVHRRFFSFYDNRLPENGVNKRRKSFVKAEVPYDVQYIVPSIRKETFRDVHILFSGVIPTNLKVAHEATEIWKMATAFGASCHRDLTSGITHVVTSKKGTQKVEKARALGGIFVVWLQWFTDSVAKWQRQDESKYVLGDEHTESPPRDLVSSPPSDPNAISTDTDPEALVGDGDDEDSPENFIDALAADNKSEMGAQEIADANLDFDEDAGLELDDVDWANVNDEVEAAMMESDDDDDDDDDDDTRSVGSAASDGSFTDEAMSTTSESNGPRLKRIRSRTPSEAGDDSDELRSRLAKRKKIAADRTGMSRLKEAVTARDLVSSARSDTAEKTSSNPGTPIQEHASTNGSMESDGEESEPEEEIDDDFLARELEEELG